MMEAQEGGADASRGHSSESTTYQSDAGNDNLDVRLFGFWVSCCTSSSQIAIVMLWDIHSDSVLRKAQIDIMLGVARSGDHSCRVMESVGNRQDGSGQI